MRHFDQYLNNEIKRAERLVLPMSLIFLDLDQFKLVNDRFGHQVGSLLLGQIGARIRAHVRNIDIAFRYGGDEFVILLPGTPKEPALHVARRLLDAFREAPYKVGNGCCIGVTASVGVASYPEDAVTGQEILRIADARMYQVKGTTRDGIAFVGPGRSLNRSSQLSRRQ